ncbi:hypothetical protein QD357_20910 [Rhizobium sp. BR 317]|uniref:hypothetical protein n=1 Tax=Rhizobium sp. BR 317 TaxID=3040015 RepID=UPI0039BEE9B9
MKSEGAGAAIAERLQPDPYYDLYRHFRTLSLFGTARQHDSDCVMHFRRNDCHSSGIRCAENLHHSPNLLVMIMRKLMLKVRNHF